MNELKKNPELAAERARAERIKAEKKKKQQEKQKELKLEAAKKANAHNFVSGLTQGYDTLVGER